MVGCGDFRANAATALKSNTDAATGMYRPTPAQLPSSAEKVTDCVPLPDGEEPGPLLPDAARDTNWRPAGALEVAVDQISSVLLNGWIADGSGVPLQMRIRANNRIVHFGTAALPRPDISSTRRGPNPNVGFGVSFPVEPGEYEFCVDALAGALAATIGCVRMTVGSGGSVRGSGSTGSITTAPGSTNVEPPPPTPTPGQVVLPDEGSGSSSPTYGAVQVIRRTDDTTGFVSGWAGDPDTADAAYIDVLVDGESATTTRTDLPRADVARAFTELNPNTGFAVSFALPAEATEVCVVAISPDDGRRQPLGCQQLQPSPGSEPDDQDQSDGRPTASGTSSVSAAVVYGDIDRGRLTNGSVVVNGWAFDPNDRDRVVEVTVRAGELTASTETGMPNLEARRRYGAAATSGFKVTLDLPTGTHQLNLSALSSTGQWVAIGNNHSVVVS